MTGIRVSFLHRHKPEWFASQVVYQDINPINTAFPPHPVVDDWLRHMLRSFRSHRALFQEACSLLSNVYTMRATKRCASFLDQDVSDSGDDDDISDDLMARRHVIIAQCVREMLTSSRS